MTDPQQAAIFVDQNGIDALAVCIENVHGHYPGIVRLDLDRLEAIHATVSIPLVLHGASGVPEILVRQAIDLGVCKLNVNTEVRDAHLTTLRTRFLMPEPVELLDLMDDSLQAMRAVAPAKLRLFGSNGKATPL